MEPLSKDELAARIKAGTLAWEDTFEHPIYGDLKFKAQLPNAVRLNVHAVKIDELIADARLAAGVPDATLTAATIRTLTAQAGLLTIMELPIVEKREEETDSDVETRVVSVPYDPMGDVFENFAVRVWEAFSKWRLELLVPELVEALKKQSGETPGSDSNESSTAPTVSPSMTPA